MAPVKWQADARGVVTVTLDRPERNNAYNGELIDGLHDAIDAIAGVSGLRAVVLKGSGRHFQAGADLEWLASVRGQDRAANLHASRATAEAVDRLNRCPVPTIAIVRGACIGGGTGVIAACDIVLAGESAMFAISEVRWGLTAAVIVPQLVDAIGVRQLRRYALTGERFDATEARRIGLVHAIMPDDALDAACETMLAKILENAPDAIAETKALTLAHAHGNMVPTLFDHLVDAHSAKRQSDEAGEGLASFTEKRPARWESKAPD